VKSVDIRKNTDGEGRLLAHDWRWDAKA